MISRVFLFLVVTVYICYQGITGSASVCHIGELEVESNNTMNASIVMSVLTTDIQVNSVTWNLLDSQLVLECHGFEDEYTCFCSDSYMWTNDICYTNGCCNGTACTFPRAINISVCIPRVNVSIIGSMKMQAVLTSSQESMVRNTFKYLSGNEDVNFTIRNSTFTEFVTTLSVKPRVSKMQELATSLKNNLGHDLVLKVEGLTDIEAPLSTVLYESRVHYNCTFDSDTAPENTAWHLFQNLKTSILNNGSVVTMNDCSKLRNPFFTSLNLKKVTGVWKGTYECAFIIGPVMFTAKAQMDVALLPEEIAMAINPIVVNCAESSNVSISATIAETTEAYDVKWTSSVSKLTDLQNTTSSGKIVYSSMAHIKCDQTTTDQTQYVIITFKNKVNQEKPQQYTIPVIYENTLFCNSDGIWPKTPDGTTVTNQTCDYNTVGHKSRTCKGREWLPVFNYCVDKKLSLVASEAENFEKGLGASQEMAQNVFEGLKNFSDSETTKSTANVISVIKVLDVMATASTTFKIAEDVLPNFVESASNILDNDWQDVNDSYIHSMSSDYLKSVEGLAKNIKVNTTRNINRANINFEVCSGKDCNLAVFGINVSLYNGIKVVKTVGVKKLMDKLPNNKKLEQLSDKVIIVTQEEDITLPFKVTLDFPNKPPGLKKAVCVFWDTTNREWSSEGCKVRSGDNDSTLCVCSHLTSFSALMGEDNSPYDLNVITYTGLAVSICSLVIFLIIEYLVWSAVIKSNLSHFRHTAMVNIATFRVLADCSFLASPLGKLQKDWCLVLTICKHVFYLAMFSWMLCLSVMLVHQLIFVFSPLRKRVFMFFSSIVGYVCPIIIVAVSYLFCKYTRRDYYDEDQCWLVSKGFLEGSLYAFLLPIGTITLTNLFSMVVVILTLLKTTDGSHTRDKETAKSIFKVVLYLTPVFGITWCFGLLLPIVKDTAVYDFVNYTFTILNTFQGLFILITGCFTEPKVREELITRIRGKKKVNTQNLTSHSYTKTK